MGRAISVLQQARGMIEKFVVDPSMSEESFNMWYVYNPDNVPFSLKFPQIFLPTMTSQIQFLCFQINPRLSSIDQWSSEAAHQDRDSSNNESDQWSDRWQHCMLELLHQPSRHGRLT